MFNADLSQIVNMTDDGQYPDMDNMDIMLGYDTNEFMSSEFFDTIRSVESEFQEDFLNSPIDDFNISSDTSSSHPDGNISPNSNNSERSSIYTEFTDESCIVSPLRTTDVIDEPFFDLLSPVRNNFEVQTTPIVINNTKPSKIVIHNPKKNGNKQIINGTPIKKIAKKQILKVQQLTTNGKPVILPYGLKSIKIVNANDLKTDRIHVTTLPTANICRRKVETPKIKEDEDANVPVKELTEVKLTPEEKRLLDKEGIQLPAYHPLTKMEDRELKRIRRKIRNKISAQDSRKRKKEYVDGLEERVRRGSEENKNLMQRIKELQKKNKTLVAHINRLQSLIFNTSASKATPSTCLMIVMLSVLLVSLPNLKLNEQISKDLANDQEQISTSRSLLSTKPAEEDAFSMEEFFVFNKDDENVENENSTDEFFKGLDEISGKYHSGDDSKDNILHSFLNNFKNLFNSSSLIGGVKNVYGGFINDRGFIEPDIDEYDPTVYSGESPAKKMKLVDDYYHQNDENFVPLQNIISTTVQTNLKSEHK